VLRQRGRPSNDGGDRDHAATASSNQINEASGPPAWKTIPSWSLIGTDDHVIPADRQEFTSTRADATIETVNAGHLSLITRPEAVTKVIETAAAATS
jgi:pimeloyl-ACP methyl ester carboxylesterase